MIKMKLLDTNASNTKVRKSQKESGLRIASLSLYPNDMICSGAALALCMKPCLKDAGFGIFENVKDGRQAKTDFYLQDPKAFIKQLIKEMVNFISLCIRNGESPAFRLNTISDIDWTKHGIPQMFPQAYFFDYTKVAARLGRTPPNYDLIFSYSQNPAYQNQVKRALQTNAPLAVVFRGFVPVGSYYLGREIVDGDKSDIFNQKQKGKIVGLRLKGNEAKKSKSLFIVEPSQASPAPFLIAAE
jgi:hypothetical protein